MRCHTTLIADDATLARLRQPRRDIVAERPGDAPDMFELDEGPFRHYRRTLTVEPAAGDDGASGDDPARDDAHGGHRVTVSFDYAIALPLWWILYALPVRRALLRTDPIEKMPWWAPPERLDARAANALGLLCWLSVVCGYLGTVITQTITFAADEFGLGKSAQSTTLSAVRIGIVVSLFMTSLADRRGRRTLAIVGAAVAVVFTALGALSPDMWALGATQTIARGMTTAVAVLIVVIAAEELPSGARAYGISVIALTAALGAGIAVWALPLADVGEKGWRIIYLIPLVSLPFLPAIARRLPETRRFATAMLTAPTQRAPIARRRLLLLCSAAFLVLLFRTPASQLQNDFLRDERGYSGAGISLFTIVTSTPAGIGVFVGGRLADRRGRRQVGALGLVGGSLLVVVAFLSHGWELWVAALVGTTVSALTVGPLGVYGPELFTTRARGRANGLVTVAGVLGSVTGLLVAGVIGDHWGLGKALAVLAVGPVALAFVVLRWFPETANVELEVLNPEDASPGVAWRDADQPSTAH
jgi:MFS family permease